MRTSRPLPVLLSVSLAPAAVAAPINVPGDQPTIQAALAVASPGDEVVIAPGTYPIAAQIDVPLSGVVIRSASGDPADVILDGGGASITCFAVANRTGVAFEDITIRGFECAIDMSSSIVSIDGCHFTMNSPTSISGAVACTLGEVMVSGCRFDQNTSTDSGAALGVYAGEATVTDSVFADNATAQGATSPDFDGAAIMTGVGFNDEFELFGSVIDIARCTFEGNVSDYGGAVAIFGTTATIDRCLFVANSARVGAGLFVRSIDFGAVGFFQADAVVTNSIFTANDVETVGIISSGQGAAIGAIDATLTITNNTFFANTAEVGTTIWGDLAVSGTVCNSLFVETAAPNATGAVYASSFNLNPAAATLVDADGPDNIVGTADDDLRPAPGSPAIDAGDNACVPIGITADFAGAARFADDPATADTGSGSAPIVDIGAHEFVPGAIPCSPADLALPFGQLDFSDVVAFLGAFANAAPGADLAPPTGQWDFSDVVAFLGLFGAGCP